MHFHLPKPLHGWREFIGEVGIIVVGVLIALAAEQALEALNWHARAADARQSLSGELGDHYGKAVEWRTVEPCIAAQLDQLEQRLLASGDRLSPAPTFAEGDRTFALRAPSRPYADSVWQGVVSEGVSSHFSNDDRIELGKYYSELRDVDELNKRLTADGAKLDSLTKPLPLDANSRLSLLETIEDARDVNRWLGIMTGQLVGSIARLQLTPPSSEARRYLERSGTLTFCREHHLPSRAFAEALKPVA